MLTQLIILSFSLVLILLLLNKGRKDIIFLVMLLTFFLPFERIPTLEIADFTLKINHIIGALLISIWAISKFYNSKFPPNPLIIPSLLLIVSIAASLTQAVFGFKAIVLLVLTIFVVLLMVIVADQIDSYKKWLKVESALVASAMLVIFFSFWQFFGDLIGLPLFLTGLDIGYSKEVFGFPRIHAFAKEPLYLGNYLLLPLGIIAARATQTKWKAKYSVMLFLLLVIFLLTLSRGAIIGLVIFGLVWALFLIKRVLKPEVIASSLLAIVAIFIIALSLITIAGPDTREAFLNQLTVQDYGRSESTVSRVQASYDAFEIWQSSPFLGVGIGNFGGIRTNFDFENIASDDIVNNEYLELLSETGIFGIGSFLLLITMAIGRSIYAIRGSQSESMRLLLIGITSAFIGMLAQYNFFSTLPIIHIWVTLGMMVALQNLALKNE